MRTFQKFVDGLVIFAKYCDNGMEQEYMLGANHDEIYVYVSQDVLEPDSEDGKKTSRIGF
jgi:hypothetical protein